MILGCVFEVSPPATEGLGPIFRASIISTMGPSFLTFGQVNIFRVLEGSWNLIRVVSRWQFGAPDHDGQAGFKSLRLGPTTRRRRSREQPETLMLSAGGTSGSARQD